MAISPASFTTDGKTHEVNVLDQLTIEPGAFYLLDRGYLDFARLYAIHQAQGFFVTRAKSNTQFRRRYSSPVDRSSTNVLCDQIGVLTVFYSSKDYPAALRRVVVKDEAGKRSLTMFETSPINQLLTPPSTDSDPDFEPLQLVLL